MLQVYLETRRLGGGGAKPAPAPTLVGLQEQFEFRQELRLVSLSARFRVSVQQTARK